MKLTYSVRPVLRQDKKKADGTCPIHFSVRVGATTTRLTSGKSIDPKDWDAKNNSPKKKDKFHQLLATFINKKTSGFETFMLTQESLGKSITLTIAMSYFRDNTKVNFYKFWEDQITLWQHTKENNTLKSYKSGLNIVKEFNPKLNFGDLNYDCIQKFDLYLRNERNNAQGGCFTKHKVLKAVINQAIMKGFMSENPYRYFKIKAAVGHREFLSIEEVKQIMSAEISESDKMMTKVRDLFLFSCFTGLRFSDVMKVKVDNIKTNPDRLEIQVQKTDKPLTIPLFANAKEILHKYNHLTIKTGNSLALPKIDNAVINRALKVLMEFTNINKKISFHCARHSFASNLIENGTYINHIKDLLGHSNITQTQIYAKSLAADLYNTMDKLNDMYKEVV